MMGSDKETKDDKDDVQKGKNYTVFMGKKYSGGPHGLGDPDDKFLRKIEKDVLIAKIVRERSRKEKCVPEVEEFHKCCLAYSYAMVFKCRKENEQVTKCLTKWWNDEKLWEECTEQYLQERSEYRRTGEPKKVRDFKARFMNTI